ncbi:unnamed protein product [Citrullus colocynthis]|uniref:Uncharacterized protein n=1 Tax=Citrullus colocynthis TaxID=252529 RepID=A0ABP0YH74_9ROSI
MLSTSIPESSSSASAFRPSPTLFSHFVGKPNSSVSCPSSFSNLSISFHANKPPSLSTHNTVRPLFYSIFSHAAFLCLPSKTNKKTNKKIYHFFQINRGF